MMFLKQKIFGKIKGRGCADRKKHKETLSKDETSAPTVATDSLFLTCLIEVMEERDVEKVNLPCAFMQAYMEGETVHLKLEGKMVDILAKMDPQLYSKYIRNTGNHTVMYVDLKKCIYGTLQAALLF